MSHRSPRFRETFIATLDALRELLQVPSAYTLLYFTSATEVMERCVQACAPEATLHRVSGAFSQRFFDISQQLGRHAMLEADRPPDMICVTQNETSSGTWLTEKTVAEYRASHPDALLAVDMVSSLPIQPLPWEWADISFFSVQKGFGCPAGLAVGIFSPRALKRASMEGSFHNVLRIAERAERAETIETPNVLGIHLLGCVARDMLSKGLGKILEDQESKLAMLLEALEFYPLLQRIDRGEESSPTVVLCEGASAEVLAAMQAQGIQLGTGYGKHRETQVRIANFPAHSVRDYEILCKALRTSSMSGS